MPKATRANIAICYDFDGTLIRGNMQENSFFPDIGICAEEFWCLVKKRAFEHDMDEVLAYMHLMIEKAREAKVTITREALTKHGRDIDMFPGVEEWFSSINDYCRKKDVEIEHFAISSGLMEMIEGSPIAKEFRHIFASGFSYDANGIPTFAARSVNYTTKTQYLFRINKGILNSWNNEEINRFTPDEKRPCPFSRMMYIGDGETDVPAMKMINYQGGYSIAVYPPKEGQRRNSAEMQKKKTAEELVTNNRAQFVAEASFQEGGPVYEIVTMLIGRIVDEHRLKMNLKAR